MPHEETDPRRAILAVLRERLKDVNTSAISVGVSKRGAHHYVSIDVGTLTAEDALRVIKCLAAALGASVAEVSRNSVPIG